MAFCWTFYSISLLCLGVQQRRRKVDSLRLVLCSCRVIHQLAEPRLDTRFSSLLSSLFLYLCDVRCPIALSSSSSSFVFILPRIIYWVLIPFTQQTQPEDWDTSKGRRGPDGRPCSFFSYISYIQIYLFRSFCPF